MSSHRDPHTDRLPPIPAPTRRERFFAGYFWFILKNLIGWVLILLALVAGPLVPGPGGIPLFLIGFALVTFPGKRKLTARVLRGRPMPFGGRAVLLTIAVVSVALPALGLWLGGLWSERLDAVHQRGAVATAGAYLLGVAATCLLAVAAAWATNLVLRLMPLIRRRVRPWLRHHRIRLLPPRRRRRLSHEHGMGPVRLKDEILSVLKRARPALDERR